MFFLYLSILFFINPFETCAFHDFHHIFLEETLRSIIYYNDKDFHFRDWIQKSMKVQSFLPKWLSDTVMQIPTVPVVEALVHKVCVKSILFFNFIFWILFKFMSLKIFRIVSFVFETSLVILEPSFYQMMNKLQIFWFGIKDFKIYEHKCVFLYFVSAVYTDKIESTYWNDKDSRHEMGWYSFPCFPWVPLKILPIDSTTVVQRFPSEVMILLFWGYYSPVLYDHFLLNIWLWFV